MRSRILCEAFPVTTTPSPAWKQVFPSLYPGTLCTCWSVTCCGHGCVCVSGCLLITQGQQLRLLGLLFSSLTHFPRCKRSSVKCLSDTPGFPQCIVGSCSLTWGLIVHPWRTRNHFSSLECVRSWKHFSLLCLCPLTLQVPQEVSLFFLELRYSFGRALPIQSLSNEAFFFNFIFLSLGRH